jgi:hypothetical protein
MKFSHFIQPRLSFAGLVTDGEVDGAAVDTRGFEQIQACIAVDQLPLDGVVNWKVQSVDDLAGSNPVDLVGAVGDVITVTDDTIVANVNLTNVAFTVAAQPPTPSRLRVEVVDTVATITVGDVTISGLDENGKAQSEVLLFTAAAIVTTSGIYSQVDSVVAANFATLGGGGDETIEVGIDNSSGVHVGRIDGTQAPRFLRIITFPTQVGATGNYAAWFNLYTEKRQPTVGEYGEPEFGFQI